MGKMNFRKHLAASIIGIALLAAPFAALAQTRISMPKNKYKVQDDIRIGNEAAAQVEQQFPILNDRDATAYLSRVGERLVAAIPPEFRQPQFDFRFKIVNASDINAFALPGGPMYVNRGMIEAAKNEGEMAGVMAHEISHVALRHATAQQTKMNSPLNQIFGIGTIIGGAIIGGQAGAQIGSLIVAGTFLRYSRDYETQADILGARIMANAGYDPRDLANMFRTIASENRGGRAPEWLSSHPDPGNRYEKIMREAQYLNVSPNPIKITRDFARIQERLRSMPPAKTMAEIEREFKTGGGKSPTAGGRYSSQVPFPSVSTAVYRGNIVSLSYPSNWRLFESQSGVIFAPEGAYGDQGITHGAMIGIYSAGGGSFSRATETYVEGILQANPYLRQRSGYSQIAISGRQGFVTELQGRSPVTNRNESVTIFTVPLRNGDLLYIAAVSPADESARYSNAFRNLIASIRLND
jgi:Zn-dependent protease with chaperone function